MGLPNKPCILFQLELNVKKIELFWPSCDGSRLQDGLFPPNIERPRLSVKLLGGVVSRNGRFIKELVMKRDVKAVELMHLLPQLRDP